MASIDKQLVIEHETSSDPHKVGKHFIVDLFTHIQHAVDSDRVDGKRARPQDPEEAEVNETGEGEDKKALIFQARSFLLLSGSGGSDTYQSKYVQDVWSSNKQGVPSHCVGLEASDQSIDGSSSVDTGVVISIHDAIIREQALSNIVVADTSAGTSIDHFCNSSSKIIMFFLRSFLIRFQDHELFFHGYDCVDLFL